MTNFKRLKAIGAILLVAVTVRPAAQKNLIMKRAIKLYKIDRVCDERR